jgi:hypothetical protein
MQSISNWWIDRSLRIRELTDEELLERTNTIALETREHIQAIHTLYEQLCTFPMQRPRAAAAAQELADCSHVIDQNYKILSRLLLEFATRPYANWEPKE